MAATPPTATGMACKLMPAVRIACEISKIAMVSATITTKAKTDFTTNRLTMTRAISERPTAIAAVRLRPARDDFFDSESAGVGDSDIEQLSFLCLQSFIDFVNVL